MKYTQDEFSECMKRPSSNSPLVTLSWHNISRPTAEKSYFQEAAAAGTDGQGRPHHGHQDPDQGHWSTPAVQLEYAVSARADHT